MAKPLGPKSILIRQAITAHADKGNTAIADLLNDSHDRMDDKIKVTANDVAQQRQAMKKTGATAVPAPTAPAAKPAGDGRRKPGRKPGGKPGRPAAAPRPAAQPTAATGSPVDLIDRTFALAQECGGFEQLKRLVDRLSGV